MPDDSIFQLPEKIIQFGTGAFLRGLADYFVDKANRQGIFNGRIVVVKSTDEGDLKAFERQDNLYTLGMKGVQNGKLVEETIISSSISRVLSAKTPMVAGAWICAKKSCHQNCHFQIRLNSAFSLFRMIFINGRRFHFPENCLLFYTHVIKAFGGNPDAGVVIVPTELISDNGKKLESIVLELAHRNGLESCVYRLA